MTGITLTRRRIIAGTAALATGATGLALATDRAGAQAEVSLGELDVRDSELSPEDGEVYAPWLIISGAFEWRTEAQPAEWQAYALVGDGSANTEAVGMTDGEATTRSGSGTYALTGAITAASAWDPADFAIPDGQDSISVPVPVSVVFVVRDPDGGMIVQARVEDTAVVTVTPGGTMAALSGSGEVVMQDNSDDPTPEGG